MTVNAGKENGKASRLCTEIYTHAKSGWAVWVDTEDVVSVGLGGLLFSRGYGEISPACSARD